MDKVQTIERSLRCFALSLWGLVPVLGLPLAVHSMFEARRLRRSELAQWNPARPYVTWSAVLGGLGIVITVAVITAIVIAIINHVSPE